jgi:hypothetical protein
MAGRGGPAAWYALCMDWLGQWLFDGLFGRFLTVGLIIVGTAVLAVVIHERRKRRGGR